MAGGLLIWRLVFAQWYGDPPPPLGVKQPWEWRTGRHRGKAPTYVEEELSDSSRQLLGKAVLRAACLRSL